MKQLVLYAVLWVAVIGCGDNTHPGSEDCVAASDEDGNGMADCDDPACAASPACRACGNGKLEVNEGCDDGNRTDSDGCDNNCQPTGCGNGVMTAGEACDDGNRTDGDGCDSNCTVSACSNGIPAGGETCDDGNTTDDDGCDSNCTITACGNGIPTSGEVCDDGNTTDGDSCDSNCTFSACGNSVKAPDEACDDGNTTDDDGCDSNCTITACGNGIPTSGEACDDGNTTDGDGCDVNCTFSMCGNNIKAPDEECDDGNTTALDGCSADCLVEPLEIEPNEDGTPSMGGVTINGNDFGTVFPDANGAYTRSVTIRAALSPVGDEDVFLLRNTSIQTQVVTFNTWNSALGLGVPCGTSIDTVIQIRNAAGVSLDSNNNRNDTSDRCSTVIFPLLPNQSVYAHVTEFGDSDAITSYVLDIAFKGVVCGDGVIGTGEQCDDGNAAGGDGCSALCHIEPTAEVEPNNTFPQATGNAVQITGDTTIQGAISPVGDQDTYRVTVATPRVVRFETLTSFYDCNASTINLRLFDAVGTQIIADVAGFGINQCGAIIVFLDVGTYFVRVEERGNNATVASYLLQVDYQTDRGVELEPPSVTGTNDTVDTADRSLLDGSDVYVFGSHLDPFDADIYSITVSQGARIRAEVVEGDRATETCESGDINSRLRLYDQAGTLLADNDDTGRGYCSLIDGSGSTPAEPTARNNANGTQIFYLLVTKSSLATGTASVFTYRLQVTLR